MKNTMTTMTKGQLKALEAFRSGRNVFLSGEAGTGKSFILNHFLGELPPDSCTLVCAPTGIAAINVHGATMHRTFGIPPRPLISNDEPKQLSKELLQAKRIVIDEISMCRFDVFDFVARCILKAERISGIHKQLILIGDFFQLPPVLRDEDRVILCQHWGEDCVGDGYAFRAPRWKDFDFVNVLLTEQVRQQDDTDFAAHLNAIRTGDSSAIKWFNRHAARNVQQGVSLCPTNREAAAINAKAVSLLPGVPTTFRSYCTGKVSPSDKPTEDILTLKPGMRVMSLVNDRENRYQNGSLGTIKIISEESRSITVLFENGQCASISPFTWEITEPSLNNEGHIEMKTIGTFVQLPVRVAYAITIHKSQGQTFSSANLSPSCFAMGQLYVAMSRLTSISGLHLTKKINPKYLKTSQDVLEFYRNIG